jgi:hypothetical protein
MILMVTREVLIQADVRVRVGASAVQMRTTQMGR